MSNSEPISEGIPSSVSEGGERTEFRSGLNVECRKQTVRHSVHFEFRTYFSISFIGLGYGIMFTVLFYIGRNIERSFSAFDIQSTLILISPLIVAVDRVFRRLFGNVIPALDT